jgi:hypothetical protein
VTCEDGLRAERQTAEQRHAVAIEEKELRPGLDQARGGGGG